jgi:hypothetical protein
MVMAALADTGDNPEGIFARTRRTIAVTGWVGLPWGLMVGSLAADPEQIPVRLAVYPEPSSIIFWGVLSGGLILGLLVGLFLMGSTGLLRWSTGMLIYLLMVGTTWFTFGLGGSVDFYHAQQVFSLGELGLLLGIIPVTAGIRIGRQPQVQNTTRNQSPSEGRTRSIAAFLGRLSNSLSGVRPTLDLQTTVGSLRIPKVNVSVASLREVFSPPAENPLSQRSTLPGILPPPRRVATPSRRSSEQKLKLRKGTRKRKYGVTLRGQSNEVCPFCLEGVTPRDRRGVVYCDVCGTAHHADCWAVTG